MKTSRAFRPSAYVPLETRQLLSGTPTLPTPIAGIVSALPIRASVRVEPISPTAHRISIAPPNILPPPPAPILPPPPGVILPLPHGVLPPPPPVSIPVCPTTIKADPLLAEVIRHYTGAATGAGSLVAVKAAYPYLDFRGDAVNVTVRSSSQAAFGPLVNTLKHVGATVSATSPAYLIVSGYIPLAQLKTVANSPLVINMRANMIVRFH